MKLCRFELTEEPGELRSGLYYDGRIYETDGTNAIGVHDLEKIKLFPPLGQPPVVRLFDTVVDSNGDHQPYYSYANPTVITGPNSEVELPAHESNWDFEIRVCGVIGERGEQIDATEAPTFILGYTLMVVLTSPGGRVEEVLGFSPSGSRDYGIAVGPFLITPDEVTDAAVEGDPTLFRWNYEILVNDQSVARGLNEAKFSFSDLLGISSLNHSIQPGEIIAWPPLEKQPVDLTPHGRYLLPTDKIVVKTEHLGILVLRLS